MTTNAYFNNYFATNEQSLIDSFVVESIQIKGLDVAYIQRSQDNIDFLYNEDPTNIFDEFTVIEMWPAFVEGYDGEELMSMFGSEFKRAATFIVSRTRFEQELPDLIRPREGDLIYMPVTNAILEIKYVNKESPFFELGKQYIYELKAEMFEYSYEDFSIDDSDELAFVDKAIEDMLVNDPTEFDEDDYAKNDEIEEGSEPTIIFDPNNPFKISQNK